MNSKLSKLLPPKLQIDIAICEKSYYEFFCRAWHVLEPEQPFEDNWHVKYLCDQLQIETERIVRMEKKSEDLIINIPPRSLKSNIVTVLWNAWAWISYPHLKFITASYSQELSTEHAVKTRRLVESEWYQNRFGQKFQMTSDQNVKTRFENNFTGSRRATSVGGTVTGGGADIIICDDPHKVADVYSELLRIKANDWWGKTMFSRLNNLDIGLRVVVMQRLHEDDLTGNILSKKMKYKHISISANSQEGLVSPPSLLEFYKDGLFSPRRFSNNVLDEAKQSLGSRDYAGQYLQLPSPQEGDLIQSKWFKKFSKNDTPEGLVRNFYVDTAYGKEQSDNSAVVVYSYLDGNIYIWHCFAWNLKFPDFIKRFKSAVESSGYDYRSIIHFEPKASGISVVQALQTETTMNVVEDTPPTESKYTRVASITSVIEAGRVYLWDEGQGLDELVNECVVFPNGKNDDRLDAFVGAIKKSTSGGYVSEMI